MSDTPSTSTVRSAPGTNPEPGQAPAKSLRNKARGFVLGVARMGCGIGIALILLGSFLGVAVLVYQGYEEGSRARRAVARDAELAPLGEARGWEAETLEPLGGSRAELVTKWDRRLYIQFSLRELPEDGLEFASGSRLILQFRDKDGFLVVRHDMPTAELMEIKDAAGRTSRLQFDGTVRASSEEYSRFSDWAVGWSGVTVARKKVDAAATRQRPRPPWRARKNWRALKKGMTEDEIRGLLGEPTKIQARDSFNYWIYGGYSLVDPQVRFRYKYNNVYGRELWRVDAWEEPNW